MDCKTARNLMWLMMRYETKRDVFDRALAEWYRFVFDIGDQGQEAYGRYEKDYDAALPDDLPVIPQAVGEWLSWCKRRAHSLKDALDGETRVSEDTFATAWVLGAWRVEETGEIVKLEAEK